MSKVYRGKFMELFKVFLDEHGMELKGELRQTLYEKEWVVYAKRPFGGPQQVIEYLGRYTHKTCTERSRSVAISNHRLQSMDNGKISFSYKDYRDGGKTKTMTLEVNEFLRRFCMHILPKGFRKIRHYGMLSSRNKPALKQQQSKMGCLPEKRTEKGYVAISKEHLGFDIVVCPCCKKGKMETVWSFKPHAPPLKINDQCKLLNPVY